MRIAFHASYLLSRGLQVAIYDYAHFNELLLGNESIIISMKPKTLSVSENLALDGFAKRFNKRVLLYEDFSEVEDLLDEQKIEVFYALKSGRNDGIVSKKRKTVIHAVFQHCQPHGDVYAYISEWLSNIYGGVYPFVPHMVHLPETNEDMREELGIPREAIVFGRHGAYNTFDIAFVKRAIRKASKIRSDRYFLFLNTERFTDESVKNVIYLEATPDVHKKTKFINTCDAMIHARTGGESFGLSIGEFSIRNKPVLTFKKKYNLEWRNRSLFTFRKNDKAHLEILGTKGIYYHGEGDLLQLFLRPDFLGKETSWNCYAQYSPEKVMHKFKQVFLD